MTKNTPDLKQLDKQTKETQQTREGVKDLQKNFTIAPDGTVVKINDYFANPETPEKQLS